LILSQIVAFSENKAIGYDNKLLWHYSEDLKYFKEKTSGKILILGRKTFDSFGKPLPKRFHIVISRSVEKSEFDNVIYVSSIDEAYAYAEKLIAEQLWPEEVMICGGAEIYRQTLKDCDFLFLTRIPGNFVGDTFYDAEFTTKFTQTYSKISESIPELVYEIWSKNSLVA
jgi:dihydrofolate reductase